MQAALLLSHTMRTDVHHACSEQGTVCKLPPQTYVHCLPCFPACMQTVRFLHDTLSKEGYRVVMLHGERSQPEREDAMRSFRGGKAQVCVWGGGGMVVWAGTHVIAKRDEMLCAAGAPTTGVMRECMHSLHHAHRSAVKQGMNIPGMGVCR
eukprot:scaffold210535_cov19-Tisochrysis_lutea.AAC.3